MRKGGIDCIVCMFGAPYSDCCLKDCGKLDRCQDCDWYDKRVIKVTTEEKENQNGKEKKMD